MILEIIISRHFLFLFEAVRFCCVSNCSIFRVLSDGTAGVSLKAKDVDGSTEKFTIFEKGFSADVETGLQGVEENSKREDKMKKVDIPLETQ